MEATRRQLVWVKRQHFEGWACAGCAWVFKASGPIRGDSIEEMKMQYELQRDKEFASHACGAHPRAKE